MKQQTLLETESIGEAIETARELHQMAILGGEATAARLIYVLEVDTHTTDEMDEPVYRYEIVGSEHAPRRGEILWHDGEFSEYMVTGERS